MSSVARTQPGQISERQPVVFTCISFVAIAGSLGLLLTSACFRWPFDPSDLIPRNDQSGHYNPYNHELNMSFDSSSALRWIAPSFSLR